jgi:glutathione S-transferase
MMLTLHHHPLSSYCWKVLIALYELDLPFERRIVDLGDAVERTAFLDVWPIGKFPVLQDEGRVIPESSIIVEYLDRIAGGGRLVPQDSQEAWKARAADRFYDQHIQTPMQKIVTDRLRPAGESDAFGVEQARSQLGVALALIEADVTKSWAIGESFSMADCAAAPALYYANRVAPFGKTHPCTTAYLERLKARPSFARVLAEAEPYFAMFPGGA